MDDTGVLPHRMLSEDMSKSSLGLVSESGRAGKVGITLGEEVHDPLTHSLETKPAYVPVALARSQ